MRDPFVMVCCAGHPLARGKGALRWRRLADHDFIGMGRDTGIRPLLRATQDLPEEIQAHVSRGTLTMGHARALLGLVDPEVMEKVADAAIRGGWSVRVLEQKVREANEAMAATGKGKKAKGGAKGRPVWLKELEETLMDNLATPVTVRYTKKRSQIILECGSREEFERLYERLKNA